MIGMVLMTSSITHLRAEQATYLIRHTIGVQVAAVYSEPLRAPSFIEVNTWESVSVSPLTRTEQKSPTQETYIGVGRDNDALCGLSLTDSFHVAATLESDGASIELNCERVRGRQSNDAYNIQHDTYGNLGYACALRGSKSASWDVLPE